MVIWQGRNFLLSWWKQCKVLQVEEYDPAKDRWIISNLFEQDLSQETLGLRAVFVIPL